MQFDCRVEAARYDEAQNLWRAAALDDGRELTCRFLILTLGLLSIADAAAATRAWRASRAARSTPSTGRTSRSSMAGKRVAVIGTGATGIQVIGEIADKVGELTVFQRRPNWSAPLNNGPISDDGDGRHPPRATTRSSPPAPARRAASSTSPTGAASTRSRARSGWRCGTSSTTSPASASGWPTSARSSWTRRPTPSSPSTSPTASAGGSRIPRSPRS